MIFWIKFKLNLDKKNVKNGFKSLTKLSRCDILRHCKIKNDQDMIWSFFV